MTDIYNVNAVGLLLMVAVGTLLTLFWDSPFLLPVKLLSVLVHEMWHGIVAMLTGGTLEKIHILAGESGETSVSQLSSGIPFYLSVSAGYIGTAITGMFFLNRALRGSVERLTFGTFTILLWYISYIFTEWAGIAFFTGTGWALLFTLILVTTRKMVRFTMIVVGTIFVWYCFYDTLDFSRDLNYTDAGILARRLIVDFEWMSSYSEHQLGMIISGTWIIIMILSLWLSLKFLIKYIHVSGKSTGSTGVEEAKGSGESEKSKQIEISY